MAKELPNVERDRFRFTYCAGDDRNVEPPLTANGTFDWVLVDGGLINGDQKELFQSLRAIGFLFSDASCGGQQSCRVEWTPEGVLELHCCMQGRRENRKAAASQRRQAGESLDGFVFEYHAPMKKTG